MAAGSKLKGCRSSVLSPTLSGNKRVIVGKNAAAGSKIQHEARKTAKLRHSGRTVKADTNAAKIFADSGREAKHHERLCSDSGKAAAAALFVGDSSRVKGNIRAMLRRPELREALKVMGLEGVENPRTKRQRAIELCVKSLVDFAKVCLKTNGSRSLENQNTLDAAMASWVDAAIFDQRLGREVGRLLQQEWKVLRKGARMHAFLANTKSWVRACKAELRRFTSTTSFTRARLASPTMPTRGRCKFLSMSMRKIMLCS
jgi:hypothetical protein